MGKNGLYPYPCILDNYNCSSVMAISIPTDIRNL